MPIENTSERDPLLHLAAGMGDHDEYVTGMERAGQAQIVHSDVLPAEAPWAELAELGFVKGEPVEGDSLFVGCTLPQGWRREGSEHAMWSYVLDERGVRRVAVFYKAAYYDRRATAHIARPGSALATGSIYGDGPPVLPAPWGVLTEEEREDFRRDLQGYMEQAADCPQVYGDRVPRVKTLIALAGAS